MSTEAAGERTFPLFASLPPEIRVKIWLEALPDSDPPALVEYQHECWQTLSLERQEQRIAGPVLVRDHTWNSKDETTTVFDHAGLGKILARPVLAAVSHEARYVAMTWRHKRDIKNPSGKKDASAVPPTLLRHFRPQYDVLYISMRKYDQFRFKSFEDAANISLFATPGPEITRVAIPASMVKRRHRNTMISNILAHFPLLEEVLVVIGGQPRQPKFPLDKESVPKRRWEINDKRRGPSIVYNNYLGKFRDSEDDDMGIRDTKFFRYMSEDTMLQLWIKLIAGQKHGFRGVGGKSKRLPGETDEDWCNRRYRDFKIQPVFVVRR